MAMSNSQKQQLEWVNIAKGIAICAVVLWHIDFVFPTNDLLPIRSVFGATWHVPVFFMISGFFIHEEQLKNPKVFIGKKMSKLYLQLLYYYIPCTLLHNTLIDWGWYDTAIDYHGKVMSYWGAVEIIKRLFMAMFFAGTEPILGAMWFLYVLLLAFIGYSIVSFVVSKFAKEKDYELYRSIILLGLCILSCSATQLLGFTIPRGSNTLTAMWLIYCGYVTKNKLSIKFSSFIVAIISFFLVWHLSSIEGCIHLNDNTYKDVAVLTISSLSALYMICYFSKKIESKHIGRFLALCGRDSFHIMALHLIGFKVGLTIYNHSLGYVNIATQKPDLGTNYPLVAALFLFSILFSLGFMFVFRKIKTLMMRF
jgi:fucose 4-O-acetylase-like acetyltransferase